MADLEWLECLERDFARNSTDARPQTYSKLLTLARRALEQPAPTGESAQGGWVAVIQDAYDSLTDGDAEGAIKKLRSVLPPPPSDPSKGDR
jgi:hypothetical protein